MVSWVSHMRRLEADIVSYCATISACRGAPWPYAMELLTAAPQAGAFNAVAWIRQDERAQGCCGLLFFDLLCSQAWLGSSFGEENWGH